VVARQWYYPYGAVRGSSGTLPTQRTFTGQYADSYIKLVFMGARAYNPEIGRFVSADSIVPEAGNPQALNRYSYVANSPLKYVDPSGHCWGIASGLRGTWLYGATCPNIDMALTIIQHPEASAGQKIGAGVYLAVAAGAHFALAAGSAGLACGAVGPACVKPVEAAIGIGTAACADGDCANEINLSAKLGQDVWQMGLKLRGEAIERAIGRSPQLHQNFPTIDRYENGLATSIKSIDLAAKTYQNIGRLTSTVQGYINQLYNFNGASFAGTDITVVTGRQLILAIPPNATAQQLAALQQLQAQAAQQGINLVLQVVK
jgi:RHS repeat-associated protein